MNIKQYDELDLNRSFHYWTMECKWNCYNYMNYYYHGNGFYDSEEHSINLYGLMIEDRCKW